jgi:pyruvate/2-oxoglutarate dehydrogenase complex dihydrolipoamide acyltransferase (E2) component
MKIAGRWRQAGLAAQTSTAEGTRRPMATDIILPKLGFTMTEGTVAEWLVPNGAQVEEGQVLYALEAEKTTQEIEAPASGALTILVEAGTEAAVGTLLATIS